MVGLRLHRCTRSRAYYRPTSSDPTASSPSLDHGITRDRVNSFSFPALGQAIEVIRSTLEAQLCFFFFFKEKEEKDAAGAGNQLPSIGQREILEFRPSDGSMESDDEIRRVPDFGFQPAGPSTSGREAASADGPDQAQPGQRRRGRSVADKEHKQLKSDPFVCFWCVPFRKRMLRNRVSAQQARERKKAYLNDLEATVKDLEGRNSELEERMSTLQNENNMLRQVCLLDLHDIISLS
ncbi:hypothetical protein GW17_00007356 [Ensete ventricosum]|nr:hypothetical protein GW17_00007356 [Ensete ventricosum]